MGQGLREGLAGWRRPGEGGLARDESPLRSDMEVLQVGGGRAGYWGMRLESDRNTLHICGVQLMCDVLPQPTLQTGRLQGGGDESFQFVYCDTHPNFFRWQVGGERADQGRWW